MKKKVFVGYTSVPAIEMFRWTWLAKGKSDLEMRYTMSEKETEYLPKKIRITVEEVK